MEQKDRLAYEVAMASLQDAREDCLRWLEDLEDLGEHEAPVARRRFSRWFGMDPRPAPAKGLRAS
jgi:hypothetical protein